MKRIPELIVDPTKSISAEEVVALLDRRGITAARIVRRGGNVNDAGRPGPRISQGNTKQKTSGICAACAQLPDLRERATAVLRRIWPDGRVLNLSHAASGGLSS